MEIASLSKNVKFNDKHAVVQVLLETEINKEIRIAMKKGQVFKEHKTPFPIVVEIFEGQINFGVAGQIHILQKGDLIALEGDIPHDLESMADSIVRLSLSKGDKVERVKDLAND